jgi:hypothetical protein
MRLTIGAVLLALPGLVACSYVRQPPVELVYADRPDIILQVGADDRLTYVTWREPAELDRWAHEQDRRAKPEQLRQEYLDAVTFHYLRYTKSLADSLEEADYVKVVRPGIEPTEAQMSRLPRELDMLIDPKTVAAERADQDWLQWELSPSARQLFRENAQAREKEARLIRSRFGGGPTLQETLDFIRSKTSTPCLEAGTWYRWVSVELRVYLEESKLKIIDNQRREGQVFRGDRVEWELNPAQIKNVRLVRAGKGSVCGQVSVSCAEDARCVAKKTFARIGDDKQIRGPEYTDEAVFSVAGGKVQVKKLRGALFYVRDVVRQSSPDGKAELF